MTDELKRDAEYEGPERRGLCPHSNFDLCAACYSGKNHPLRRKTDKKPEQVPA